MEEEGLEALMTQLDAGHVTKLDILLPPVTNGDDTHAVGLVTNPKNVQVKEVNQGGVLHTRQQEDFKIRRQIPIIRDTLRHGDMKLIKEVLEVPTTQSDVGHAIKSDMLLPHVTH